MTPAQREELQRLRDLLSSTAEKNTAALIPIQNLYRDLKQTARSDADACALSKLFDANRWLLLSITATEHARDLLLAAESHA